MIYLLWALPPLIIAGAIGIARISTTYAAALGLLATIPVSIYAGDVAFGYEALIRALARGAWIGTTIAPYILGGLLFWQVALHRPGKKTEPPRDTIANAPKITALAQRRTLFFACFLVGPFAESATGFGVGMLGTVALLRSMNLAPRHLMVFALLSQTMIPWGAMGSGTLLAAAYARMTGTQLAMYTLIPTALLMLVWLPLYWRTARLAGLNAPLAEALREVAWIAAGLTLIAGGVWFVGPETALLAAYGPLIVVRYLVDYRPSGVQFLVAARRMLPYIGLIGALAITRMHPTVQPWLASLGRVMPFADLPAWSPFLHAGSWLIIGSLLTALLRGQLAILPHEARTSWATGKHAVISVFLFAMMAELLSGAGISQAFARSLFVSLHNGAVFVAPLVSAMFGVLTNSGNMPNSLFMPSQIAIATQAGFSVAAVAALQHISGTAMSMLSPVRMSIAAGLAHGVGEERRVYGTLLPYAIAALVLMQLLAVCVVSFY